MSDMKTQFIGDFLFTGSECLDSFAMTVQDGRILRLAPRAEAEKDCETVDLSGGFVLPGLIDAHVHLRMFADARPPAAAGKDAQEAELAARSVRNAQELLGAGIVACRDLGSARGSSIGIRNAISAGDIVGPRVVAAGRAICATGGHGVECGLECDGADAVTRGVRQVIKDGADVVKLMVSGVARSKWQAPGPSELSDAEIAAGIEAAHMLGRKVSAHANGESSIKSCVRAGIDSIEHGVYLTDELMDEMKARGTFLVPTLSPPYHAATEGQRQEPDDPGHKRSASVITRHRAAMLEAFRRGVPVAMGSDAGTPYNPHAGAAYELVLMVEAGLTAREAIVCATVNAAALLDIEDELGILSAGKEASFLVLKGNPFDDISAVCGEKSIYLKGKRLGGVLNGSI